MNYLDLRGVILPQLELELRVGDHDIVGRLRIRCAACGMIGIQTFVLVVVVVLATAAAASLMQLPSKNECGTIKHEHKGVRNSHVHNFLEKSKKYR